jgi:RNA polymerase sigma-70 factor (ECF subfamily)
MSFVALSSDTSVLRAERYEKSLTMNPLKNPVTPSFAERSTGRVLPAPPDVTSNGVALDGAARDDVAADGAASNGHAPDGVAANGVAPNGAPDGVERRLRPRPEMDPEEARRLVEAATAGDDAAWEALYRSLYPRLRAFFVRRVGYEHADDTVGETMMRAVASIDRFVWTDAGFDGWVFGIARHVAVDHHRRQGRVRRYHHITRMFSGNKTDGTAPVEQDLVIGDDQALIRDLFTQLTPAEQEVLELRVIAGLSAEEVGEVLGHKAGAVRTAQSRALAHLRQLMVHHDG